MAKRSSSTTEALKFGQPPMRGFLIHLLVYIIVVGGLAAPNQELPGWRIRTR